jgi:hypothetical protein
MRIVSYYFATARTLPHRAVYSSIHTASIEQSAKCWTFTSLCLFRLGMHTGIFLLPVFFMSPFPIRSCLGL